MNYIENIYLCIAAPLLVAIVSLKGKHRKMMIFLLSGMTSCLLSSYITTFLSVRRHAETYQTAWEIAPMIEELMKLLPVLFYLMVFEPKSRDDTAWCMIHVAVGFATFENICWLTANGASHILLILIRGFGTGAMHVVCGAMVSAGLMYMWKDMWLRIAGTTGILTLAFTYHGIYNILVEQDGAVAWIGYIIPMVTTVLVILIRNRIYNVRNSAQIAP